MRDLTCVAVGVCAEGKEFVFYHNFVFILKAVAVSWYLALV